MKKTWITYGIVAAILLAVSLWIRYLIKKSKSGGNNEEDARWLIAQIDIAANE